MGKKKELKVSKNENKEGSTVLVGKENLRDDSLDFVELKCDQGVSVDKDGRKERKKKKMMMMKVVEVDDIDEESLKSKKAESRNKGNEVKVMSQEADVGKERKQRVSEEIEVGTKKKKKDEKYGKEYADGGVNSEMNDKMEDDRKVKKRKRKREKANDDVVDDRFSDAKEMHYPAIEKESKVKEKKQKRDLFGCKESKRVTTIGSIDSEGNEQVARKNMGEHGKKMKTKITPTGNKRQSEGRNGFDSMETEGQSQPDDVNSDLHRNGKVKNKNKKKIELAHVESEKHLPEGDECCEELTAEAKSAQGVGSSEMGENDKSKSKKTKMRKGHKHLSEGKECNEVSQHEKGDETSDPSAKPKSKKKSRRVSFSDEVEVLGLVRGKRFTKEEDKKIIDSVHSYVQSHGLGDEGVNMILNCSKHPEVKNCWKDIAAVLPHRPQDSVYYRAHTLLERDDRRKWTDEERELVRRYYDTHGADWKTLADALGKHRKHVKDLWRRIRHGSKPKSWTQEEYQTLFDLVNQDLRMRAVEENRKSKYGMLRDNIPWEAISDVMTRSNTNCCLKWYGQLTSPMVADGCWMDTDDYRLLAALYELDACCMEEVEWDLLLEHRTGDLCRKRWNQMVRHIDDHRNKSFAEQVEILSKRYCPELVEDREAFDSKPVVD